MRITEATYKEESKRRKFIKELVNSLHVPPGWLLSEVPETEPTLEHPDFPGGKVSIDFSSLLYARYRDESTREIGTQGHIKISSTVPQDEKLRPPKPVEIKVTCLSLEDAVKELERKLSRVCSITCKYIKQYNDKAEAEGEEAKDFFRNLLGKDT